MNRLRMPVVSLRRISSVLFVAGLGVLIAAVIQDLEFGAAPMVVGQEIVQRAPDEVGAANLVTAVLLAYRGLDTLGELTILFVSALVAGLVLGQPRPDAKRDPDAGFVLRTGADLLFPFLITLGAYIIIHGHLTPGGGFQGGTILAAAFFLPHLARPASGFPERVATVIEGLAGAAFIGIGLLGLLAHDRFLTPLLGQGDLGTVFSAGSLPLLYLAVGLKVGAELGGLVGNLARAEAVD
jgi:multicomponent Na+:H+ antiporter subunit B